MTHKIRCPNCSNTINVTDNVKEEEKFNTFWIHEGSYEIGEEANFAIECQGCGETLSVDMKIAWELNTTF